MREREMTEKRADGRITRYFLRFGHITPSPTLPGRQVPLPRGRRLHNCLRDVGMARPSSSPRQPLCRFAPCFYDSREKFVDFGSAEHGCSEPAPVAVKILISRKFVSKCQARFRRLPAVLRLRNSDFKKNRRNVFSLGTYLRPKMSIRIGEDIGIFQ